MFPSRVASRVRPRYEVCKSFIHAARPRRPGCPPMKIAVQKIKKGDFLTGVKMYTFHFFLQKIIDYLGHPGRHSHY